MQEERNRNGTRQRRNRSSHGKHKELQVREKETYMRLDRSLHRVKYTVVRAIA